MNEDTLVKTMPLPHGRDWEFFADANVIALSPDLCPAQREQALSELQAQWRRSGLRLVETIDTQPLTLLPPQTG